MQIVSEEHFDRMQMMQRYFESNSKEYELYLPEFIACKRINTIIQEQKATKEAIQSIKGILEEVDRAPHKDDMHWLDYKIHVSATLKVNAF